MASGNNEKIHNKFPREHLTLTYINEKVEKYPTVVNLVQTDYEVLGLPSGVDILLDKPKHIQFARIRILDYDDKEKQGALLDEYSINVRRKYIGQEFLIPTGYSGRFKLISKIGRYATLISVSQIIQDLPRYIVIEEETLYTPPGQSQSTCYITAGTRLELRRVFNIEHCRYIECLSDTAKIYIFSEDFPLNITCIDDPDDHTFQELIQKAILLPKKVKFQNIPAKDVIKSDAEDAKTLLKLLEGPVEILETWILRKFFVAWMKLEERCVQTVGLIPRNIWSSLYVEKKAFSSESSRRKYIQKNFSENIDSNFLVNGLYTVKPGTDSVVWIRTPQYLADNSGDDDTYVELWSSAPVLPPRQNTFKKATTSYVSIPDSRLRQVEQLNDLPVQGREPPQKASEKPSRTFQAPTNENDSIKEKTKTGIDKVDSYYNIEEKAWHSIKESNKRHEIELDSNDDKKVATLPDLKKLSKPDPTEEDFHSYSVEELVDCFRFCGLDKFAEECSENKLDGDFFRNFDLDELKSEPFCLKIFDVSKVKKIIHEGWRPKLQ